MNKIVTRALCVAACALLAVSCAKKADSGADNSLKAVMDKKSFILGLDDSFPPDGLPG